MAKVKITGHASGTGVITVTAPNTSTDRTITLPDATGTLLNSDGDGSSLTNLPSTSTADILTAATIQKTATSNIGLGTGAVDSITTGDYNVGVGDNALTASTTASENTAIGYRALLTETTGIRNVAVGYQALKTQNKTDGSAEYNVGVGFNAGALTTNGVQNTFLGGLAGTANTTGANNTFVGYSAGNDNTTASNNTAVGYNSLTANTTGAGNTAVGDRALSLTTTGNNNVAIGEYAQSSSATASSQFTLGSSNISNLRCNDTSISSLSDERDKTSITNSTYGLTFVNTLQPRQFKWQTRDGNVKDGRTRLGFTAQELLTACDGNNNVLDLVLDDNPEKLEAKYSNLIPILTKAIQELSAKNDALEARITALEP